LELSQDLPDLFFRFPACKPHIYQFFLDPCFIEASETPPPFPDLLLSNPQEGCSRPPRPPRAVSLGVRRLPPRSSTLRGTSLKSRTRPPGASPELFAFRDSPWTYVFLLPHRRGCGDRKSPSFLLPFAGTLYAVSETPFDPSSSCHVISLKSDPPRRFNGRRSGSIPPPRIFPRLSHPVPR